MFFFFFIILGNPGAPQSHGSRMVENVRAVFPQLYQKHFEQHGLKASAMAQHDLHLERSVLFITLVGKVSLISNLKQHCTTITQSLTSHINFLSIILICKQLFLNL